jgi:AcrR family transcriptional regulator
MNTPPSGHPVEDRSGPRRTGGAAMRTAIVDTAERLFRTLGYQKTAVADIARELGMSPANVYRFFPSKLAINEAVCARMLDALDRRVMALGNGPESPPDRLRAMFRLMQRETMALFFEERRLHDMVNAALEQNWPVIREHVRTLEAAVAAILRAGQANGTFAVLDPERTARLVHATTTVFTYPSLVALACTWERPEELSATADAMAEFVLRALRP